MTTTIATFETPDYTTKSGTEFPHLVIVTRFQRGPKARPEWTTLRVCDGVTLRAESFRTRRDALATAESWSDATA